MIDKIVDGIHNAYDRVEMNIDRMVDEYGNTHHYIKSLSKNNTYYHRDDGPAFEASNGNKEWFQYNERHRLDGPAVEYSDGRKYWYQNGKLHREDGPAVEYTNYKTWYKNGKKHRLDGPAVELNDGCNSWYYEGKHIDCSSQEEFERLLKLKAFW